MHPSPNSSAPQTIVWLISPNRKFQKVLLLGGQKAVNNKQYISSGS